ncbi:MAG: PAS domain-containing protein [Rubrivivax sp.]|jgi:PAS domain S-box-containing protein|nr:PAS domain-containing protein [Rubrivivax sp.]
MDTRVGMVHANGERDDFASLFDFLPLGCYRSLPDGTQLRANPALLRLNGYDTEAQQIAAVRDIATEWYVDPSRRDEFKRLLERDGQVAGFVSEVRRHKTRERIWVSENAHVVRDALGRVLYYEGTVEEITARVAAEAALRESEQRWKHALEASVDGVWDWHVPSGAETLSPRLLDMYGYAPGELAATVDALDALTHPDDRAPMIEARCAHLTGRAPAYVNEHRILCRDGRWKWVLSRGLVIERDAGGEPVRMIGTHTDIDERKQAEALARERERVEIGRRTQTRFLSRVSHELRTPLNGVLGFAQLIEMDPDTAERQRGWAQQVLVSGRQLLALVDDLLDLSRVQAGELRVEPADVDLGAAVREGWTMVAPAADAAGLRCELALAPGLRVRADPRRLRQILGNLMSNAVKYNRPGGRVTVSGLRLAHAVELRVSDTGPGLTAAQAARIFQPFERLDAPKQGIEGTGLGLALSRDLAQAMGGALAVESLPGEGATFVLELPSAG